MRAVDSAACRRVLYRDTAVGRWSRKCSPVDKRVARHSRATRLPLKSSRTCWPIPPPSRPDRSWKRYQFVYNAVAQKAGATIVAHYLKTNP